MRLSALLVLLAPAAAGCAAICGSGVDASLAPTVAALVASGGKFTAFVPQAPPPQGVQDVDAALAQLAVPGKSLRVADLASLGTGFPLSPACGFPLVAYVDQVGAGVYTDAAGGKEGRARLVTREESDVPCGAGVVHVVDRWLLPTNSSCLAA